MSKLVTWLGDEDQSVREIVQYGHRFVVGEPVEVHGDAAKLEGNAFFSAVDAVDPAVALKAALDARSIPYRANASLETLRTALAAKDE